MPRKFFRKYLPSRESVRQNRFVARFGSLLRHPNLWHLNRRSVSGGVAAGMFAGLVPGSNPVQFAVAALLAVAFRVNLPGAGARRGALGAHDVSPGGGDTIVVCLVPSRHSSCPYLPSQKPEICRRMCLPNEEDSILSWQLKRDGTRRGIVQVARGIAMIANDQELK